MSEESTPANPVSLVARCARFVVDGILSRVVAVILFGGGIVATSCATNAELGTATFPVVIGIVAVVGVLFVLYSARNRSRTPR